MNVGLQAGRDRKVALQIQGLLSLQLSGLVESAQRKSIDDATHLLVLQPMGEALQLALGRHPHRFQAIDPAEPLIERIPGQRATEASIILLQERAQNRASKRSATAHLESLLLASAHAAAPFLQPSLESAFHEIALHGA